MLHCEGYELVSTLPTVVYRTETFPGLGFLLKKSFFDALLRQHMNECCMNRFDTAAISAAMPATSLKVVHKCYLFYRRFYRLFLHLFCINVGLLFPVSGNPACKNMATQSLCGRPSITHSECSKIGEIIKTGVLEFV